MTSKVMAFLVLAIFAFQVSPALACTVFRMPSSEAHILIGRTFDWDYGHGLMIINKRGVAKSVIPLHASDQVSWTSKYGSLTFNQAGRELPYGGLNEKGLMIDVLWLGYTAWPQTSAPSINETQWIQYQLDMRSSVGDLISHLDEIRIEPIFAKVHFFACDATGACASIEGRGDHVEVHSTSSDMTWASLTNDPYRSSVAYAKRYMAGQPNQCAAIPQTESSLDRFANAACLSSISVANESARDEAVRVSHILDVVEQEGATKWKITYDLTDKSISIRTQGAPVSKTVSLSAFNFSCATPVQVLDLNATIPQPGDVSRQFVPYTEALNRSIVEKSLLNGFAHLGPVLVEKIVKFPDETVCTTPSF